MKLDYQEIQHNFIVRLVLYSIFLFKEERKDEIKYKGLIQIFLERRLRRKFPIDLSVGPKMSLSESRENVIDAILYDKEIKNLNFVEVKFSTSFKEINMVVNLSEEAKYESIIYA